MLEKQSIQKAYVERIQKSKMSIWISCKNTISFVMFFEDLMKIEQDVILFQ